MCYETGMHLAQITATLVRDIRRLRFGPPVTHVYNPLEYAHAPHDAYIHRFGGTPREVLLLGMNPGPWGMAQTGVPFGDVASVRDWLGIEAAVGKPDSEHPKRRVEGFACPRNEVSGKRLWGWAHDTFRTPQRFFDRFFVANYCPLTFLEAGGRNRTPDKLPAEERKPLFAACDNALCRTVEHFRPKLVIGVGAFAEARAREALAGYDVAVGRIPHPSPASPAANRGWSQAASAALAALGIGLPKSGRCFHARAR